MKEGIKNIIFDLGGVLIDLNFQRSIEAFSKVGFTDMAHEIQSFNREGLFMDLELGNISTTEFYKTIQQKASLPVALEQIADYWNLILLEIPDEKLELIRELRKHYTVHLLSNTNEPHWTYICQNYFEKGGYSVGDYFEKTFLSYQMHLAKPDKAIFEKVLSDANLLPEETLFIDDSEANCMAAQEVGIHAHRYHFGDDLSKIFE